MANQEHAPSTPPEADLPRSFGPYTLFDHIGRGGMANIYLARQSNDVGGARLMVIKEILPELAGDQGFADMLVAEAKLAAHLTHGNVVQVLDLGREDGRLYIAMEYVEGFDLNEMLRSLSRARVGLPAEFALLVVRETLRALDYAHRAKDDSGAPLGIVHRDVSPSNVLISFEGEVKLCDFGIARAFGTGGDDELVERTRVAGKSAYMAPEQARGEDLDPRADLFAAGILLWELCSGRRMYKGSEKEMLALARAGVAPDLADRGLPSQGELEVVLFKMLATDRADRYSSCAEALDALEDYAITNGVMASQLRFGSFLTDHFSEQIVGQRRERERFVMLQNEFGTYEDDDAPTMYDERFHVSDALEAEAARRQRAALADETQRDDARLDPNLTAPLDAELSELMVSVPKSKASKAKASKSEGTREHEFTSPDPEMSGSGMPVVAGLPVDAETTAHLAQLDDLKAAAVIERVSSLGADATAELSLSDALPAADATAELSMSDALPEASGSPRPPRTSLPPGAPARLSTQPFTLGWYILVLVACGIVAGLVYFAAS